MSAAPAAAAKSAPVASKNYVVSISVSQGKHIPISSQSIIRVECGAPANTYELLGRSASPVYNDSRDIFCADLPQYVSFTLLEPSFLGGIGLGAPTERARFKVQILPSYFEEGGKRHRACPLCYNTLTRIDADNNANNGGGVSPDNMKNMTDVQRKKAEEEVMKKRQCGELEVEIKCAMKDKAISYAYRDTMGVLSVSFSETKNLDPPSQGSFLASKKAYFVEVNHGLNHFCTKPGDGLLAAKNRGAVAVRWKNDTFRLWVYEATKGYRVELTLVERALTEKTGGNVIGHCLLKFDDFVSAKPTNANGTSTVRGWAQFEPAASSPLTSSDRDDKALDERTKGVLTQLVGANEPNPNKNNPNKNPLVFVEFTFSPKGYVETRGFEALWKHFDGDNSGTLDRVEVAAMMDALRVNMSDDEVDKFVASVDASGDGQLDHDEVMRLLRSGEFQKSALSAQMMSFLLDGKEGLDRLISGDTDAVKIVDGHAVKSTAGGVDEDDMGLLIFDRRTGSMLHEHIPTFIKIALKSMYRTGFGRKTAQTSAVRSMLVGQSVSEGKKMDDPASAAKIPGFIEQYGLDTEEMLLPVPEYKTFNEFFYRRLKPTARPIDAVGDDAVCVSPADCRMSVFKKMTDATKVWIKGSEFTVEKLLGPRQDLVPLFTNPTLVIARLAPQDYHRCHCPVTGEVKSITPIDGTLYTVNPIAVRQEVNVYTENKRMILEVATAEFGTVVVILVGATMVGSIVLEDYVKRGARIKKGDPLSYFAFGGSTTLMLFQPGAITLDQDLQDFSQKPIEVLVRCNSKIGKATGNFAESCEDAAVNIDNLRSVFGNLDADNSGFLDRSEAIACVSMIMPDESIEKIVQIIRGNDFDGDGRLSFLEFVSIARDVQSLPMNRTKLANRLQKFYSKWAPDHINRIAEICDRYVGREDELFAALVAKYGPEP